MNIKQLREITGLTQQKFGERFKIPLRSVQNWESGQRQPPEYVPRLIEMQLILENENEQLRSDQTCFDTETEQEQQQQQPQEEEKTPNELRKEIFETVERYLESNDFDGLNCKDCKHSRNDCIDYDCSWSEYKYYKEWKEIWKEMKK